MKAWGTAKPSDPSSQPHYADLENEEEKEEWNDDKHSTWEEKRKVSASWFKNRHPFMCDVSRYSIRLSCSTEEEDYASVVRNAACFLPVSWLILLPDIAYYYHLLTPLTEWEGMMKTSHVSTGGERRKNRSSHSSSSYEEAVEKEKTRGF